MFGGKLKSFDAAKVAGMKGVKKVVQVGDDRASRSSPTPGGRPRPRSMRCRSSGTKAPNAKVSSASIAEWLKAGLDAADAFVGNQNGDAKAAHRRRGQEGRGGLLLSVPEPRRHGADERDRALHGGQVRGLGPTQNGEAALRRRRRSVRPAGRQMRRVQDAISAAASAGAAAHDYVQPGGADRQADAGHAGQAALVARRGHDARPLPSDHAVQADRRLRCQQQPDRAAHAHFRPVDPRRRHPQRAGRTARIRRRSRASTPAGRKAVRLHHPEPADRPRDAQPARPAAASGAA